VKTEQPAPQIQNQGRSRVGSRAATAEPDTARAAYAQAPTQPSQSTGTDGYSGLLVPQPLGVPDAQSKEEEQEDEEPEPEEERRVLEDDEFAEAQQAQLRAKATMNLLIQQFSREQSDRYHAYRHAAFNKYHIRKVIQSSGLLATQTVAQMVAGVSKVFVGEIVEKALEAQASHGEVGPLTPEHIRTGYREYKDEKGNIGPSRPLRGKRLAL